MNSGSSTDQTRHSCCSRLKRASPSTSSPELNQDLHTGTSLSASLPPSLHYSSMAYNCSDCPLCSRVESGHLERLRQSTDDSQFTTCSRTHSLSFCPSRSVRTCPSKSLLNLSSLIKQLRLFCFLILLCSSLFDQIELAAALPLQQQEGDSLPDRCVLPFSNYNCSGVQQTRYTYRNGSCHSQIEWSGLGCEYDGTENSFATREECEEVCIPETPTTAPPTDDVSSPVSFPPQNDSDTSTVVSDTPTVVSDTPTVVSDTPTTTVVSQPEESTTESTVSSDQPTDHLSICFLPLEEFTCTMVLFPTSYFYYDHQTHSCESVVSFCKVDRPNIFDTMEECLNTCKRPLEATPAPSTEPGASTESSPSSYPTSSSTPSTESRGAADGSTDSNSLSTTTTGEGGQTTGTLSTTDKEDEETTLYSTTTETQLVIDGSTTDGSKPRGRLSSLLSLNKFDLASVALGVVAIVLIFVLVGVVMFSLYRRHARLRKQKQEVMDSKKNEVKRTLAFTSSRHDKSTSQTVKHSSNTSMSTTSSTISSYLTTV